MIGQEQLGRLTLFVVDGEHTAVIGASRCIKMERYLPWMEGQA